MRVRFLLGVLSLLTSLDSSLWLSRHLIPASDFCAFTPSFSGPGENFDNFF